jgi:uncharacterized membrane protein (UPF0182 family)
MARKTNLKDIPIWGWIAGAIVLLLIAFAPIAQFYTDFLWFTHDAQHPEIFTKTVQTRALLWGGAFAVSLLFMGWNILYAIQSDITFAFRPGNEQEQTAVSVLEVFQNGGKSVSFIVSLVLSLSVASAFSTHFQDWWFFTNAVEFGQSDPVFNQDLGFFVFKLPWLQLVAGRVFLILAATLALCLAAYYGTRALARVAKAEVIQKGMKGHLGILGGLTLVGLAWSIYVNRYGIMTTPGALFTGPGYVQMISLKLLTVVSMLTAFFGVALAINSKWGPEGLISRRVLPGFGILAVLTLGVVPPVVQTAVVKGNKIQLETPFVERAIAMTRYAYGLDQIEEQSFDVSLRPTNEEIANSTSTLSNMRLWDPRILGNVLKYDQTLKPFYSFNDVDIDRYEIDGEQRMVMVAPRDLRYSGVNASSRSWQNEHLVYSHGYGVVMSTVSGSQNGEPQYQINNIPPEVGPDAPAITQSRIYFSYYPYGGEAERGYVIIPNDEKEFDFPDMLDDAKYAWTGGRGVPFTSFINKLCYAGVFGDFVPIMTTKAINADSRIVYRRDIVERASLVYPMLTLDSDPYIVVNDGKLVWMMDAYTTTGSMPYSRQISLNGEFINYIRNSVKIVVDAYTGEMNAYEFDSTDPILKAVKSVFPDLIRPRSDMPEGLVDHIRAAEDGFEAQANILTEYHVKDPRTFLTNEDAWEIPSRVRSGLDIRPYYVQMRLPGEEEDSFQLILPFTPREKPNMIGWMSAQCDPEEYGKMMLFKFPKNSQTMGPAQMGAAFDANKEIADINRQLNNQQSEIVPGNLMIIPVGSSILYVKPLFLQSRSQAIPELKKVALGLQNQVVVADTYEQALDKLFGSVPAVTTPDPIGPGDSTPPETGDITPIESTDLTPTQKAELRVYLQMMDDANAALRNGDFATYGELQEKALEGFRGLAK